MKQPVFLLLAVCCTLLGVSSGLSLETPSFPAVYPEAAQGRYWISSTGKTHNSNCRYYNNCRGYFSDTPSGNNCKLCGGSGR